MEALCFHYSEGYGGLGIDFGWSEWEPLELVWNGMLDYGSIWVGLDGPRLNWFARVWVDLGKSSIFVLYKNMLKTSFDFLKKPLIFFPTLKPSLGENSARQPISAVF